MVRCVVWCPWCGTVAVLDQPPNAVVEYSWVVTAMPPDARYQVLAAQGTASRHQRWMHYYDGPTAGLLADTPGRYQLNLHVRLADRDPEGFRVRQAQAPLSIEVERNIDTEPVSCTF